MSRICFAALYAYPLFNPAIRHIFGGAEVRAWLFGVGLSKCPGNEVSFVVINHGQPEVEHYGLIKVYRHLYYRASSSFQTTIKEKVRNLFYRLKDPSSLSLRVNHYRIAPAKLITYEKVKADIYCTFGVSNFSAELAAFCRRYQKKFILFSSSEDDFSSDYYPNSERKNAYGSIGSLCYYSIMKADLIVTHTQKQSELLLERFGRSSVTVLSPIELTCWEKIGGGKAEEKPQVLWIGKSDRVKQPDILLDLAVLFPNIPFLMILNRSDPKVHEDVLRRKPKNLRILESVDYRHIEGYFARAFLLINTSVFEGFPNTFLQAGKYGVPILSLQVDPDGFIEQRACGIVAKGSRTKLVEALKTFSSDRILWQTCSQNIKRYVHAHHGLSERVHELNHILTEFMNNGIPHDRRVPESARFLQDS